MCYIILILRYESALFPKFDVWALLLGVRWNKGTQPNISDRGNSPVVCLGSHRGMLSLWLLYLTCTDCKRTSLLLSLEIIEWTDLISPAIYLPELYLSTWYLFLCRLDLFQDIDWFHSGLKTKCLDLLLKNLDMWLDLLTFLSQKHVASISLTLLDDFELCLQFSTYCLLLRQTSFNFLLTPLNIFIMIFYIINGL